VSIRSIQESQRATKAAIRAADAAIAQAKISEDTARRQLRAYIFPRQLQMIITAASVTAHQKVHNAGQTPAYHVNILAGIDIRPHPIPDNANFAITPSAPIVYAVINPGETLDGLLSVGNTFGADMADKIKDGNLRRLYVYGSIVYRDIFLIERHSNFCFSYYGEGAALNNAEHCAKHNDAD
jgi:hypothetical protein